MTTIDYIFKSDIFKNLRFFNIQEAGDIRIEATDTLVDTEVQRDISDQQSLDVEEAELRLRQFEETAAEDQRLADDVS